MKSISIVIPIHNEAENIKILHQEIKTVCEKNNYEYEIIFIDDGSRDNTEKIAIKLSPIKYIKFRKNFGQTAAMDAGIKNAKHEYIITMDGDRQNDPVDIPKLIDYLEKNNLDVVSGWRKNRKDSFFKNFISRGANILRYFLVNDGIHDSGCSLKIYKKQCFENIDLYGEMHRFIPAILKLKGFQVGEVIVNHRSRVAGVTKYGFSRTLRGFLDMLSIWFWKKYANRPLHLFGGIGFFIIVISIIAGLNAMYMKINYNIDLSETAMTELSMFGFFMGVQFFIFGLISDMVSKNYYSSSKDQSYSIKEIIEQ